MTSLEIAQVTGKQHKNVMQAIRNMEPAWIKTCGLKFQLTSRTIVQPNGGTREVPCYQLTKTECLYIATKFEGIRIHAGNCSEDTEGCILVGKNREVGKVLDSRIWVHRLKQKIVEAKDRGEAVWITIK